MVPQELVWESTKRQTLIIMYIVLIPEYTIGNPTSCILSMMGVHMECQFFSAISFFFPLLFFRFSSYVAHSFFFKFSEAIEYDRFIMNKILFWTYCWFGVDWKNMRVSRRYFSLTKLTFSSSYCLAHEKIKSKLAGVVTLASSIDYTTSKSSLKLLLPLVSY